MRNPLLSVVICTHNRVVDVGMCVAALIAQATRHELEIIVIDSGSEAPAAAALAALAERHAMVRSERIEEPGISLARNLGLRVATSEWVAFLDDDALPAPDWADQLLPLLAAASPQVALLGGRIAALFPAGADTSGITDRWKLMLSCLDSDARGSAADGFNICGANFVVRRASLLAIGGFPLGLGRVGGRLIGGEECFVIKKLLSGGQDVLYEPAFAVQHRIHPDRIERAWIERRAFWEGVTQVALVDALDEKLPRHLSPLKLAASLPFLWLLMRAEKHDGPIRYQMALGALYASVQRLRPARRARARDTDVSRA